MKLIAEPWDVGPGGYQVGNFPMRWAEWNGKYRDAVRQFWRGETGQVPEMASRDSPARATSSRPSDRGAYASINFITAHDGYTLHDLVSYEQKHNEANGEDNRDGHNDNVSRNWGVEGETTDPAILDLRYRLMRTSSRRSRSRRACRCCRTATRSARTQRGNNNAYAQDNELTWVNWELDDRQQASCSRSRGSCSPSGRRIPCCGAGTSSAAP